MHLQLGPQSPKYDLKHHEVKGMPYNPPTPFESVLPYSHPFLCYRPFWDKCTEWAQNVLEVKVPRTCFCYPHPSLGRFPNFNPFCLMASCFRVTSNFDMFETSSPNDPKMTLNLGTDIITYLVNSYLSTKFGVNSLQIPTDTRTMTLTLPTVNQS